MGRRTMRVAAALLLTLGGAGTAGALPGLSFSADLATDHRRRGISWSEGRAAAELAATVSLANGLTAGAAVTSLRGSARHGGADAVFDASLNFRHDGGAWHADAGLFGHAFAGGRGGLDYVEVGAGIGTLLGPVSLDASLRYAPDQAAIGGDNLYVAAQARAGLLGTPFTISAGIGRSLGSEDGSGRSARLRLGGDYTDWAIGVDHVRGPLSVGLAYTGTDIPAGDRPADPSRRHAGERLVVRIGLSL